MPNLFRFGSVACLRRLIPGDVVPVPVLVLPPVVLPLTRKHAVVLPTADPESSRTLAMVALDTTPETVCVNVLKVGGRFTANAEPSRTIS